MAEAVELLFEPGFSTAEQTSDISGRGVGMDAVRSADPRARRRGHRDSPSRAAGTAVQVRLPLTLAILPSLLVALGRRAVRASRSTASSGRSTWRSRSSARSPAARCWCWPTACCRCSRSRRSLGYPDARDATYVVVVRGNGGRDRTRGRPTGRPARAGDPAAARSRSARELALSGGAVLPDGSIALIVDCDALAGHARARGRLPTPQRRLGAS